MAQGWTVVPEPSPATAAPPGWTPVAETPHFSTANEKDAQGNAVVRGISSTWDMLNTPLVPQIGEAAHAIANYLDQPGLNRSRTMAQIRGYLAGTTGATGDVLSSFTSPVGIVMALAGLAEDAAAIRAIPALKGLLGLSKVKAAQRAIQATGGVAFGVHGAVQTATAPTLAGKAQGVAEMASGLAGGISAVKAPRAAPMAPQPRLSPIETGAVEFAQQRGIPLDAATATGSPTLRAAEKRVANSMGGEGTAERLIRSQQQALTRVGGELADQAHPTAVTTDQAGDVVHQALTQKLRGHASAADQAYDRLRQLEEQRATPTQTGTRTVTQQVETGAVDAGGNPITQSTQVAAPVTERILSVDVKATKARLKPLYDRLMREKEIAPPQGAKARALMALDRLMNGPDIAALSVVDGALGDIKALARGAEMSELRTEGQGLAAFAVKHLETQVRQTALRAGPDVLQALEEGRAATIAKYATADVLDTLRTEPVQAYRQLTAPKDTKIALLRTVMQETPQVGPQIARAYLEDALAQATERGHFDHADRLYANWQKLGTETKRALFPSPGHAQALDHFFLLAKKLAENPNPSGTAHVNTVFNVLSQPGYWAVAKVLYTPRGVRAVTRLLAQSAMAPRVLVSRPALVAGWAEVAAAARAVGVPLAVPSAADATPNKESTR